MCPDRQILSVFLDGELPSPWKEKMEAHLQECPRCRADLERYAAVSQVLATDSLPLSPMEAAQDRVWQELSDKPAANRPYRASWPRQPSVWRRSLSVPTPVAAAVAAVLVIAFIAAFTTRSEPGARPQDNLLAADMGLDVQGMVPVSDMNGIMQYLGQEDTADIVIIRLPESRNFVSSGEPTILTAADYSRRSPTP
jgi:anti-sigma factor RsiW